VFIGIAGAMALILAPLAWLRRARRPEQHFARCRRELDAERQLVIKHLGTK
jgi:hypothetical protein